MYIFNRYNMVMKNKVGRPIKPKTEQRDNVLRIRLTASEREILENAAQLKHLDTSSWVRSIILTQAEKDIDTKF